MWMPNRSLEPEIMDSDDLSEAVRAQFHKDLKLVHRLLGGLRSVVERIQKTTEPVRSVIDIGCGDGAVLAHIRDKVGAEVTGIDLRPPDQNSYGITILQRDATRDEL